jgi:hypothetical protein
MKKMNCWEFKQCGCQPGGHKVNELGVCPAATEMMANGIHGGTNGGRCCWAVLGTYCGNGTMKDVMFTQKLRACMNCEFYKTTFREEFGKPSFHNSQQIVEILKFNPAI